MNKIIYVVDKDIEICKKIVDHLNDCGYNAKGFNKGLELIEKLEEKLCDLVIIDANLDGYSGYDIAMKIRKHSDVPIFMISDNINKDYVITAFEIGCDDYIEKPINLAEISKKAEKLFIRITQSPQNPQYLIIKHNDLEINLNSHTAKLNTKSVAFTPKEFNLLVLFMKNKNLVFSREQIIENIWKIDSRCDLRQVDHLVKRLRKKINECSTQVKIDTVWGLGYKLSN